LKQAGSVKKPITPLKSSLANNKFPLDASITLGTLFVSSFLAATLLPGGSEAVLFAVLKLHPEQFWPALGVATLGNTLGGLSSYLLGRLIPQTKPLKGLATVQRWGSPALLLSWVPLLGDPLCVAAGWLRLNPWWSTLFIAIGKFGRYWVIAALVT
jgi:membrane protein YqaA with SNARE-associated domain